MTQNKSTLPPDEPGQEEPLSATGMFRRAFEPRDDNSEKPLSPPDSAAPISFARQAADNLSATAGSPAVAAPGSSPEPGEFTRIFQSVPAASAASPLREPSGTPSITAPLAALPESPTGPSAGTEPGEFTRIFLDRAGARAVDSVQKTSADAANLPRPRGFSSHGASEFAAAEGSVTQLFRAPTAVSAPRPTQPAAPMNAPETAQPLRQPAAKDEDFFRAPKGTPAAASPSITNLLESLSGPRSGEDPLMSSPPSPTLLSPSQRDAGGVTQFIQKLADEPLHAPSAPPQPAPPPVSSGPGEYTRVVARIEEKPVASISQEPSFPPPPVSNRPAMPAVPSTPALKTPLIPKPAASPVPAVLPQKKTMLEALAPVLLALNTVLLVLVVVLLILLLRSH